MKVIKVFEEFKLRGLRDHHGQWWKVVQDCVRCGQCCMDRGPGWHFAQDDLLGGCRYLKEEGDAETYRCGLRGSRPFDCCGNSPFVQDDYCVVSFEKIDSPEELYEAA